MKLTKEKAVKMQTFITQIDERLSETLKRGAADGIETSMLTKELAKCKQLRIDLENQWVNLATTAVIAHYNSAVEYEFMSMWRESLGAYEKAAGLAAVAMKTQNPMSQKISQAMSKMRIKVRNNVQLPDKTTIQGHADKSKRRNGSNAFGMSTICSSKAGSTLQPSATANFKDLAMQSASFNGPEAKRTIGSTTLSSECSNTVNEPS